MVGLILGALTELAVEPGSVNFTTANNGQNWLVPRYNTLTVTVLGPGGGGGGGHISVGTDAPASSGTPGVGPSIFGSATPLNASPGLAGGGAYTNGGGGVGVGGTASGGTNTPGGAANGGAAGPGDWYGGAGGAGGKVVKTWNHGDLGYPIPGSLIALTINLGGAGGPSPDAGYGGNGGPGSIAVTWS